MKSVRNVRVFTRLQDLPDHLTDHLTDRLPGRLGGRFVVRWTNRLTGALPRRQSTFLKSLGWISAGAGALGLGLIVGRELRVRYKFRRRTPYDVYSHSGDYGSEVDFGVGI